jgi:hypothetical protein
MNVLVAVRCVGCLVSWRLAPVKQMQTAEIDRSVVPHLRKTRAGAALPMVAPAIPKALKRRIAFLYLGRRGGIARLAYELAVAATRHHQIDPLFVVSDSNELFGLMERLPGIARGVKTFESSVGALTQTYRIPERSVRSLRVNGADRTRGRHASVEHFAPLNVGGAARCQ